MPITPSSGSATSLAVGAGGVTLATIEAELARRLGPYDQFTVAALPVATTTILYADDLESSIDMGGLEGLYLWRRAPSEDVFPTPPFVDTDRVRRVKSYEPGSGALEVDRPWTNFPRGGEVVEVVALDPERRIRVAARRGLDRCFKEDRVAVTISTYAAERDLTALVPWLTRTAQVLDLAYLGTGSVDRPVPVGQWEPFLSAGHVWLRLGPDPAPASLKVTALRPHSSWVNGADSTTGPTADADLLDVDPDYAVVMAHGWLWDTARDLLRPLAADGMGTSESAVRDAVRGYVDRTPSRPDRVLLPARYRSSLRI